ncbi:hypothetical protein K437DRAFT_258210 [Tilletiaria anomala UBC 951]|uniref:Uncharacterized protein n=1 Tax=Tilletiaria anomala (strain ATCC 24038 / CBS 436.72 / UBC 951) TaxID=1037660 RepID=A0A066VJD8_TILAU|nr:uncharacterized protein K437DRAFT_258210 [Tilletiaria anomala UBC 951]KDN41616.1 hypothetical protein K437DRAFT_258210 [Tilletiaria anomala UBC 951]
MDPRLPQHLYSSSSSVEDPSPSCPPSPSSRSAPTLASRADILKCYEEAVQEPLLECSNLSSFYSEAQLSTSLVPEARLLREDFCSTAIVARTWLSLDERNRSVGVDIDLNALKDTRERVWAEGVQVGRKVGARIVQSPAFANGITSVEGVDGVDALGMELEQDDGALFQRAPSSDQTALGATEKSSDVQAGSDISLKSSTWATGAASDRFERRFQARLAKQEKQAKLKAKKRATASVAAAANGHAAAPGVECDGGQRIENTSFASDADEQNEQGRMLLVHSDVLDLPFSYIPSTSSTPPSTTSASAQSSPTGATTIPAPDLIAALNYALCYFHTRAALLAYLRVCLHTLKARSGVLLCDLFAGPPTGETYEHFLTEQADSEGRTRRRNLSQQDLWELFAHEDGFIREGDRARDSEGGGDQGRLQPLWADEKKATSCIRESSIEANGHAAPFPPSSSNYTITADDTAIARATIRLVPAPSTYAAAARSNASCAEWPKGHLKLVRTGAASGGFEYWREDGPIDYASNRFRMSLSFRFKDRSWIRDWFSYDFRIWSLKEVRSIRGEVRSRK